MVWTQHQIFALIKRSAFVVVFLILVQSCSDNDSGNENSSPSIFQVQILDVSFNEVTIEWEESTDPEGSTVFYDIFLESVKLEDNVTQLNYTFENLLEGVQYSGEIVASDPEGNTTSAEFSFDTSINQPPSNFTIWAATNDPFSTRIEWEESTDPEGGSIVYNFYLDDVLLSENINQLYYYLPELKGLTSYSIKIEAIDQEGKITEEHYSFTSNMKIYDGNLTLDNQTLVDDFGNAGYNGIDGNLTIGSNGGNLTNISNLSLLESISFVNGDLKLRNTECVNFFGLQNVEITSNYAVFEIYNNDLLLSLNGLNGIQSVDGVDISSNDLLTNLNGLENLTTITNYLFVSNNSSLNSLSGLQNLNLVYLHLSIGNNDNLTSLEGLEQITSSGRVGISNNDALLTLQGLHNLTSCSSVTLEDNNSLNTLVGLSSLGSLDKLSIRNCPSLVDLNGLQNLTEVNRNISIHDNVGLLTLDGIENVVFTDNSVNLHEIVIWGNINITDLDPLQNYTFNRGEINIIANTSLTDLCGLTTLITNIDDFINDYNFAVGNAYNPSETDILSGNCSL